MRPASPLRSFVLLSLLAAGVAACGDDESGAADTDVDTVADVRSDAEGSADSENDTTADAPEPLPELFAGHVTRTWVDSTRDRTLTVEIWYPTTQAPSSPLPPMDTYETGDRQARIQELLTTAPVGCPETSSSATRDAVPFAGTWPLLAFSHCYGCLRWSSASIASELARQGYVVVAADHNGTTLWDREADTLGDLDDEELLVRAADVRFLLDTLLQGGAEADIPAGLRFDVDRIGVLGHSFGAVTSALVSQEDERIRAFAALAAPAVNPLFASTSIEQLTDPALFLVATEDNSITEFGNQLMRSNFADKPGPGVAWLVEVADAGHWSFSDINGLTPEVTPGCGAANRQTNGDEFNYLDPLTGRQAATGWTVAFFNAVFEEPYETPDAPREDSWQVRP
ncbi:MAG: dienelactone hydrolase family protein [Myxococcales bacterium]|nr:dienelactone hydrolase family protein [Myxococcales bacterium]